MRCVTLVKAEAGAAGLRRARCNRPVASRRERSIARRMGRSHTLIGGSGVAHALGAPESVRGVHDRALHRLRKLGARIVHGLQSGSSSRRDSSDDEMLDQNADDGMIEVVQEEPDNLDVLRLTRLTVTHTGMSEHYCIVCVCSFIKSTSCGELPLFPYLKSNLVS